MRRLLLVAVALTGSAREGRAQEQADAVPPPAEAGAAAPETDEVEAAGVAIHKVKRGDTLELLAAEYYGDRRHKIYIMIENRLDHARELKPGERLRIPVSNEVIVAERDTLATLATRYLGDERRARYLAEFNNVTSGSTVAAGMPITIPLRVTYRAARRESLGAIAAGLFADSKQAQRLKHYNFLKRDELSKGETIVVPIYLRVHPSKRSPPDEESERLMRRRRDEVEKARRLLPTAREAWDKGNFGLVRGLLYKLVVDGSFPYLDTDLVYEAGVLLGAAYIALDEPDIASTHFREVLQRAPGRPLSAFDYSPKVCDVWRKAGGKVDDTPPP